MKFVFAVVAALVVYTLAEKSLSDVICSVSGTGTASFNGAVLPGKMIRVRDTVRYDMFQDTDMKTLFASIIMRPDVGKTFFVSPNLQSCSSSNGFLKLDDYVFKETKDGLDIFAIGETKMYLIHENNTLLKEELSTPHGLVVINYTSFDKTFVHEEDAAFSIDHAECPPAKSAATLADTSIQCSSSHWLYPSLPGCAFEIRMNGTLRGIPGMVVEMKVLTENGTSGLVRAQIGPMYHVLRCDMRDEEGRCFIVTHIENMNLQDDSSSYGSESQCDRVTDKEEYSFFSDEMPLAPFKYNGGYKNVTCPDYTNGCKKYCNREMTCKVVDKNNRVVSHQQLDIKYKDAIPSIEDFKYVYCNGTVMEPPESPCADYSSSASRLSSSPSSTHASSSRRSSVSSASFSIPSVVIFAVAVLLAVFSA